MSSTVCCPSSVKSNKPTTQCDVCRGNVHYACVGLTETDAITTRAKSRAIKVVCNKCSSNIDRFADITPIIEDLKKEFTKSLEEMKRQFDEKLASLKTNSETFDSAKLTESVIQEVMERQSRAKNVIIFNLPESSNVNREDKIADDSKTAKVLLSVVPDIDTSNIKITRLGRVGNNPRPLKIILEDSTQALQVLKSKAVIINRNNNIKISDDKTPSQREYLNNVRLALKRRIDAGEQDLTIRYIKGVPTIVTKKKN